MNKLELVLSFPKTVFVNFRTLDFNTARKLPIYIDRKTKIEGLKKGSITIVSKTISKHMIKIGTKSPKAITYNQDSLIVLKEGSVIQFNGFAEICEGICIRNSGKITFGNNFYSNKNFSLNCDKEICFGSNVLLGWNVCVRDNDGHKIILNNNVVNKDEKVVIHNNVWICSNANLLKGSIISDDTVVALGSIVTKKFTEKNVIIGGNPAKIIKKDIKWTV